MSGLATCQPPAPEERAATPMYDPSAIQSEFVTAKYLTVTAVAPWLTRDLSRQKIQPFLGLAKYLLSLCLLERRDDVRAQADLVFRRCLAAVVTIANGKRFRDNLKLYRRKTKHENQRYKTYVNLVNDAFEELRHINPVDAHGDPFLRQAPVGQMAVVALRHAPKEIVGRYGFQRSDRSPDVIFARKRDAKARYSSKKPSLAEPVDDNFEWSDVCCTSEFKRAHAKIFTLLPKKYDVDDELEEYKPFLASLSPEAEEKVLHQAPTELKTIPPSEIVPDVLEYGDPYPLPPDAQLSVYAAKRLGSLPCVTHTVGTLIQDDIFWLFWYDRQGIIQSTGINFVRNAPHFLIVLFAMQRFDPVNWGIPEGFPETSPGDNFISLPVSPELLVNWCKPIHRSLQLSGRSTVVYEGRARTGTAAVRAVKISHREKSRLTEDYIVARALEVVSPKFPLSKHLPHCSFADDLPHDTSWIRAFLGDDVSTARIPRITVWDMLIPIIDVPASDFVRCWLEIVHAHRLLWQQGICHLDPSLSNAMVRRVDGTYRGVLNDWDLAIIRDECKQDELDRAGTQVFMAVDLMISDDLRGPVERLYRHDLEGFMWILLWVFVQFDDNNKATPTKLTRSMQAIVLDTARNAKIAVLHYASPETKPLERWQDQWALVMRLRQMFDDILSEQNKWNSKAEELPDEKIYEMFWTNVDAYYQSLGTQGVEQLHGIRSYLGLAYP